MREGSRVNEEVRRVPALHSWQVRANLGQKLGSRLVLEELRLFRSNLTRTLNGQLKFKRLIIVLTSSCAAPLYPVPLGAACPRPPNPPKP